MPDFVLDHEPDGFASIKVVGVGGGGCNAVDSMFDLGLQSVEFYAINSDLQALKRCKCPDRIQIGMQLTRGRGCGASPELGEKCMKDAHDEVAETLQGADIVFVTAGLGGGTGTGAAPVVAQIARELGILTVAVVTRPFNFEGPRRTKAAEAGLAKLREACDTMIVINNERLLEVVGPKIPMKEAFKLADNVLAGAVSSISDIVATPGLINLDFEDIRTIMGGKGGAVMGVGVGKGENRSAEAVKKATSSPLLDKIVIDGATGVLICVTGGPDMTLYEANEAAKMIQEAADPDAQVIFGAVIDESLTDTMRVTLIATGFSDDVQRRQFAAGAQKNEPFVNSIVERPQPRRQPQPAPQPTRQVQQQATVEEELENSPIFGMPDPEPAAAPAPEPSAPAQPNSLRQTLEKMMRTQGKAENGGPAPTHTNGGPASARTPQCAPRAPAAFPLAPRCRQKTPPPKSGSLTPPTKRTQSTAPSPPTFAAERCLETTNHNRKDLGLLS